MKRYNIVMADGTKLGEIFGYSVADAVERATSEYNVRSTQIIAYAMQG